MRSKNILMILFLLAIHLKGLSQKPVNSDSLDYYVKNLNWGSIRLTPTYVPYLMLNYDAQTILDNSSDTNRVALLLLKQIEKADKAVSVHVILSKLYEPQNNSFKESYVYRGDSIIAVNYFYNTLTWRYNSEAGSYQITQESIKKIREYWERKLAVQSTNKTVKRKQTKKCKKALKRGL